MFENLSEKLERSLKNLKGEGKITEINVAETLDYFTTYELSSDFSTVMVPASIAAFCAAET